MKKLIAVVLALVCVFNLVGCGAKGKSVVITLPDNIEKITVAWNGGPLTTFSYTDSAKNEKLVEYFTTLELSPTKEDPAQYNGGSWTITISTGSETIEMVHFGNLFFMTPTGEWCNMSYEQAAEMENILKENVPDELPQNIIYDEWAEN
ncbi:MAG: hypothetical protein IJB67_04335 [Firmicutes bacterium]|nr:hypothetical protein [Bacillota bacterium]